MGYHIDYQVNMCRTIRDVRLYKMPNDIKPSNIIMPRGTTFITDHMIRVGDVVFLQIDTEEFNDLWITTDSIEIMPVQVKEPRPKKPNSKDISTCDESLFISGSSVTIYDSYDSSSPIAGVLTVGSTIKVDKKVNVLVNGTNQTRYRIKSVEGTDNSEELIGCWVLENYAITVGGNTVNIHNPGIKVRARSTSVNSRGFSGSSRSFGTATVKTNTSSSNYEYVASVINGADDISADLASQTFDQMAALTEEYYQQYGFSYQTESSLMSIPIGRMLFVHGMPFQYTFITDRRSNSEDRFGKATGYGLNSPKSADNGADFYGRVFCRDIVANSPIAVLVPGVPKYMTNVKQTLFGLAGSNRKAKDQFKGLWGSSMNSAEDTSNVIEDMMNSGDSTKVYQYYSMEVDTTSYFEYVNALCQTSAKLMGLSNVKYMGKKCTDIEWGEYNSAADQDYNMFEEVIGMDGGVSFAFDPTSSITDSMSNSTTQSEFAGMLNQLSAKARELSFLTGVNGVELFNESDYTAAVADVSLGNTPIDKISGIISNVSSFLRNGAHGMNVRFPDIWSDSSYSKDYSLDMKFIAPYDTPFCKWRYVLVPFFHLFALAAPHSDDSVANYSRPFLIRAFSKGYFNVEMGMIKDIQWRRFGDGDMISEDGVPMEIDITISFEDMYQQLAISRFSGDTTVDFSRVGIFFNNTGLVDLLGELSGVNMNRLNIMDRMSLYAGSTVNAFSRTGTNILRHAADRARNIADNYLFGT